MYHISSISAKCYTVYENYFDFIKDPSIEVVSIVVPSLLHVEYTRAALEAGKTVYLEKPIALNLDEAAELGRLHRMYPDKIFVRHNRRFEAAFNHIGEIISSGKLGEIFEVRLCRHRFQMRNDWQTMPECGGWRLPSSSTPSIATAPSAVSSPSCWQTTSRRR